MSGCSEYISSYSLTRNVVGDSLLATKADELGEGDTAWAVCTDDTSFRRHIRGIPESFTVRPRVEVNECGDERIHELDPP